MAEPPAERPYCPACNIDYSPVFINSQHWGTTWEAWEAQCDCGVMPALRNCKCPHCSPGGALPAHPNCRCEITEHDANPQAAGLEIGAQDAALLRAWGIKP